MFFKKLKWIFYKINRIASYYSNKPMGIVFNITLIATVFKFNAQVYKYINSISLLNTAPLLLFLIPLTVGILTTLSNLICIRLNDYMTINWITGTINMSLKDEKEFLRAIWRERRNNIYVTNKLVEGFNAAICSIPNHKNHLIKYRNNFTMHTHQVILEQMKFFWGDMNYRGEGLGVVPEKAFKFSLKEISQDLTINYLEKKTNRYIVKFNRTVIIEKASH